MSRGNAWSSAVLTVLLLLTGPAFAADATLPSGVIYLEETLLVSPGDTLTIGPGTTITGPGRIEVWGALRVEGSPGSEVQISVPVLLLGNETSQFSRTRLWGVNATALALQAGSASLSNVTLEANGRGIHIGANATLDASDIRLRHHSGEAVYVQDRANVRIQRAQLGGNGQGAAVYSASTFLVEASTFGDNGQHVVLDLGPWSLASPDIALHGNDFGSARSASGGVALGHEGGTEGFSVQLSGNRFHDAPVALLLRGTDLRVESRNDTFEANRVGIALEGASLRLVDARMGNDEDVRGDGEIVRENVTRIAATQPAAALAPSEGLPRWSGWLVGGALLLALSGALALRPRMPRRGHDAPSHALSDAPEEPAPLPEPARLTPQERRVLEDVADHPGTAQRAAAERLGLTRQALHYHVKKLEARGLLVKRAQGRETQCDITTAGADALAAAHEDEPAAPSGDATRL